MYWFAASQTISTGNKLEYGGNGRVVGPYTHPSGKPAVAMRFTGYKENVACLVTQLSRTPPPPLDHGATHCQNLEEKVAAAKEEQARREAAEEAVALHLADLEGQLQAAASTRDLAAVIERDLQELVRIRMEFTRGHGGDAEVELRKELEVDVGEWFDVAHGAIPAREVLGEGRPNSVAQGSPRVDSGGRCFVGEFVVGIVVA